MYFLTAQDPNYIVKGSRDPLGFQVLWQSVGRQLIPNLSTVSSSIIDFQIMCLAGYYKHTYNLEESRYRILFSRLEKLMAFARFAKDSTLGFNGVDKIRKLYQESNKELIIADDMQILSNQRAYGIWGKYNRPFQDCGILEYKGLYALIEDKIKTVPQFKSTMERLLNHTEGRNIHVTKEQLLDISKIIEKPQGEEHDLFVNTLLMDNCDNALQSELARNKELTKEHLFGFINEMQQNSSHDSLKAMLDKIKRTEQILCPLNRVFRHLQTKVEWKKTDLVSDSAFVGLNRDIDATGLDVKIQELYHILKMPNVELVEGLAKRNAEVSQSRRSAPWIKMNDDRLEVNHHEGGYPLREFNGEEQYDNSYFLYSYLHIHKQLY